MTLRLLILNGPNMNLLGEREPEIYGTTTLAGVEKSCRAFAEVLGGELEMFQSNHEGALIDKIHEARGTVDVLIINPAGLSFTSVSLVDALNAFSAPVIELHLSNIHARDELHRHSIVSSCADAVICGLGTYGYIVAMQAAAKMAGKVPESLPEPVRVGPA